MEQDPHANVVSVTLPEEEHQPPLTYAAAAKRALEPAEGQESHASQRTPAGQTLGVGEPSITGNPTPRTDTQQNTVWPGRLVLDARDGYHTLSIPTLSDSDYDDMTGLIDTEDEDKEDDKDPRGCTDRR